MSLGFGSSTAGPVTLAGRVARRRWKGAEKPADLDGTKAMGDAGSRVSRVS